MAFAVVATTAAGGGGPWSELAAFSLKTLRRQFLDSGNQRRVFAAACKRLLLPISRAVLSGEQSSCCSALLVLAIPTRMKASDVDISFLSVHALGSKLMSAAKDFHKFPLTFVLAISERSRGCWCR